MSLLRPQVRDDRGRKVDRRRLRAARPEVHWLEEVRGVVFFVCLALVAVPCGGACLLGVIDEVMDGGSVLTVLLVLALAFVAIVLIASVPADAIDRLIRRRQSRLLADLRRPCAACAYELDGLTPEADGCTICPECGAAWKLGEPAQK